MEDNELKPFYVYELRDPFDNIVFYVGKGKGTRAEEHEKQALNSEDGENKKIVKIKKIQNRSDDSVNKVNVLVVGRYDTEVEALAVEATLIKWVYGLNNLTNAIQGHHHYTIRERDDFSEIAGIDIEKTNYVRDGTYTRSCKEEDEKNNTKEKLEHLKAKLKTIFPIGEISDVDFSVPCDPSIFIQYNDIVKIQCMLKSKTDTVIINILPWKNTKEYREKFALLENALGIKISGGKEPYIKLPGWEKNVPKLQDSVMVIDRLQQAWNTLDSVYNR